MIDGKAASIVVKEYFNSVHAPLGIFGFEVEEVKHGEKDGVWSVKCAFYPFWVATQKYRYTVLVSDEGTITDVSKLE